MLADHSNCKGKTHKLWGGDSRAEMRRAHPQEEIWVLAIHWAGKVIEAVVPYCPFCRELANETAQPLDTT